VGAAGGPLRGLDGLYDALDAARSTGQLELTVLRGNDEQLVTASFDEGQ
jgi:hypothetical protein